MPIIEALGWIAVTFGSNMALQPGHMLENYNNHFAMEVDRGDSCFTRVSGFEGVYGGPHEFDLDPLCNYRIKRVAREGVVYDWVLERN